MGYFPAIERTGVIQFYLWKSLPYYPRLLLAIVSFVTGLGLQVFGMRVFPGVLLIVLALALGLASGYQSKAKTAGSPFWKEADWDALEEIIRLNRRSKRWDQTWLDITNRRGALLFVAVILQAVVVWLLLLPRVDTGAAASIYLVDVLVVAVPLWLTGSRRLLKNDQLVIQAEELLRIRDRFQTTLDQNGDRLQPMLETRPTETGDGEVPTGVQLKVLYRDMPKNYYGLQAQTNINEVQGVSYPYFYCVLVGEMELKLERFKDRIRFSNPIEPQPKAAAKGRFLRWIEKLGAGAAPRIIVEYRQNRNIDVLVIRQFTTKRSGYHVQPETALEIFRSAYQLGRVIHQEAAN